MWSRLPSSVGTRAVASTTRSRRTRSLEKKNRTTRRTALASRYSRRLTGPDASRAVPAASGPHAHRLRPHRLRPHPDDDVLAVEGLLRVAHQLGDHVGDVARLHDR